MSERKCEIHGVQLKYGRMPIYYGLMGPPPGWGEVRANNFPHANSYIMGGCVIEIDNNREEGRAYYCPECRVAEQAYLEAGGE